MNDPVRPAAGAAAPDAGPGHGVLDVEARAEPLAGAGEQDDAHVGVVVGLAEVPAEQLEHPHGDGVAAVRSVERDGGDVVRHLVEHLRLVLLRCGVVGHGGSPSAGGLGSSTAR
jgi:hypothetical protein